MKQFRQSLCDAPYRTLAVLLLMNGQPISTAGIRRALGYGSETAIRIHLETLRRAGVLHLRSSPQRGGYPRTHWLTGLPPDEMLDKTLAEVTALKRTLWWREVTRSTCRTARAG